MADDGQLSKLKEQYVDEVMAIIPLAQAMFIVVMSVTAERILSGKANSVIDALKSLGLKSTLGPDAGAFWEVSVLAICISFALALLNISVLRWSVERAVLKAKLGDQLLIWQRHALRRVSGLTDSQKDAVTKSFGGEIELRTRRYKVKRISCELIVSVAGVLIYSSGLFLIMKWQRDWVLQWSLIDAIFLAGALWVGLLSHRAAIRYAIMKILPLKVYTAVMTGEFIFFEDLTS